MFYKKSAYLAGIKGLIAIVLRLAGTGGIYHVVCFKASYLKIWYFLFGDPCSLIGAS